MRKRILTMIFAVSLLASLQGCNNSPLKKTAFPMRERTVPLKTFRTPKLLNLFKKQSRNNVLK